MLKFLATRKFNVIDLIAQGGACIYAFKEQYVTAIIILFVSLLISVAVETAYGESK